MPELLGDDWKDELPDPIDLDWEDIQSQVTEETRSTEEEDDDEEGTRIVLTHEPTGINSIADDYKTLSENRELARDRIVEKIRERLEMEEEQREEERMDYMDMEDDRGRPEDERPRPSSGGMPGGEESPHPGPDQPGGGDNPPNPRR